MQRSRLESSSPTLPRPAIFLILGALVVLLLVWKPPFAVRPLHPATANASGSASAVATDPGAAAVDKIWASKVVPAFLNQSVPAAELLAALARNSDEAGAKYGRREANNPFNYLIKGTGQVTAVNTESRAGTLTVIPADAPNGQAVQLQIGPVVLGTAVRDATGLVSFNQFVNQLDYAAASKEMNARAIHDALDNRDPKSFAGKQIRFFGAFTYDPHTPNSIRITPVKIEVVN
jgi:predicted lipoprotein